MINGLQCTKEGTISDKFEIMNDDDEYVHDNDNNNNNADNNYYADKYHDSNNP